MTEDKLRLGGMALANGVLVHGPTAWACAVRLPDGELRVESAYKTIRAAEVEQPLLRGPARLRRGVRRPAGDEASPAGGEDAVRAARRSPAPWAPARSSSGWSAARRGSAPGRARCSAGSWPSLPAVIALRSSELSSYHGAEHISIGTYEHGEERGKEHERCGSHLVGPLLVTTAIGNILAARAPIHLRGAARTIAGVGALAASTEIFGWMLRHPDAAVSRALAKPGPRAPAPARDERADARAARGGRGRSARVPPPGACSGHALGGCPRRSSTSPSRRCGRATTATSTSTSRATRCSPTAGTRVWSCRSSSASTRCSAGWTRRSRSSSSARTTGTR